MKKSRKPGKKPEHLKIDNPSHWRDAVNKALKKKRPKKGWPKPKTDDAGG